MSDKTYVFINGRSQAPQLPAANRSAIPKSDRLLVPGLRIENRVQGNRRTTRICTLCRAGDSGPGRQFPYNSEVRSNASRFVQAPINHSPAETI